MKNILFVSTAKQIGGGEKFLGNILQNISTNYLDYKPFIVCNKEVESFFKSILSKNQIISFSFRDVSQNVLHNNYTFVISNDFKSTIIIPLYWKTKKIQIIHTEKYLDKKWYFWIKMILFIIVKQFINTHVCVSENVYKSWGIKSATIIENGINNKSKNYLFDIKKIPKIGYVGNYSSSKGQNEFLDILISNKIKNEVHFFGNGYNNLYFKEKIKGNKINAIFHGFVDSREKIYRSFDILALCSHSEGYPLAPREAILYGKLIITYDVGDLKNIITNGKNGFILPIGNKKYYGEKLIKMLNNPLKILEMQKKSLKNVGLIKSIDEMTGDYIEILEGLIKNG